jgi:hypothetical protein
VVQFVTGEQARQRFRALLDRVDAAHDEMRALSSDEVGTDFRVELAERLEAQHRSNRALMYRVFGQIANPPDELSPCPATRDVIAARLRIPPKEIKRRTRLAARVGARRSPTGSPLPPELPVVADALGAGQLGEDHLRAICHAMDTLPSCVSVTDRDDVERSLVGIAERSDAEIVAAAGRRIDEIFNPDGDFDEHDRARRRGLYLGPQGPDGMSALTGLIDPETRCYLEAATAAVRPGRHLPDGTTTEARDDRTPAQRRHDGVKLGLKTALASGGLGTHRGHPVTVIATTTLAELNQAAHAVTNPDVPMPPPALTGAGSVLPMRDLIKMAADAIHYLAVFDQHTGRPIYLGRQNRIATADQRIICYARDRGCTHPDCTEPGYHCEVHHVHPWIPNGLTDADNLFFACEHHHDLIDKGHRRTEVADNGRLGWTDGTGPATINRVHHPDELLRWEDSPASGRDPHPDP